MLRKFTQFRKFETLHRIRRVLRGELKEVINCTYSCLASNIFPSQIMKFELIYY